MSTTCAQPHGTSQPHSQEGKSEEARQFKQIVKRGRPTALSLSLDWRDFLRNLVYEVVHNCQAPDWDHYGAAPVSEAAKQGALEFVELLPEGIEIPDIAPESDGKVAFEWDRGKDMLFSISVEGSRLVYAGILGTGNRKSGTELFAEGLPRTIEHLLSMYFAAPGPNTSDD